MKERLAKTDALSKPLEAIKESDLQALVDNQVTERKTLEYKEALPGNADGDKMEFQVDVSSFANASGGDYRVYIE